MSNKEVKPGDINEDGFEVEQDGWITRTKLSDTGSDNRLIDVVFNTMIQLEERR